MNDERVVEEIVTKFFLNSCRLRPRFSESAAQAAKCRAWLAAEHPDDDDEAHAIALTTGSVAEFYIEPMLPHIGDIDAMFHFSTALAIPRGHPPPTQLPAEFYNYVKVSEIIDTHFPGYVYLEPRYLLTECVDDGKYNAVEYDRRMRCCLSTAIGLPVGDGRDIHGPAVVLTHGSLLLPFDSVLCIRCLVWPSQAAHWPMRHRNYGWPDSATVDRVVNNVCDVVRVPHRQCRHDEWMNRYQWRLSFSRAEIVLINSWTPVQQIVYHKL